ncbi:major facilitator superfamily transporter [Tritrichomonas foetus]|uniref:Major facilitator superfamily transporter n=1 Tax=Tritrichomonas foetus TaxID=1144522 RepID=A0A1J4JD90_9EUKA|nr:major facilitator superfamily transporter [Tritrichomonas foetus]|eukprot:OHS96247.1 major facilitator superfamily transporter [Tritrichomonas foetus]
MLSSPSLPLGAYTAMSDEQPKTAFVPLHLRERLSFLHIIGICAALFAFQVSYSIGNSLGTPIMRRIGIPTSMISVIWIIGPLSGFIVQPLIGYFSDQCHAKLGRRRPFLIAGATGIVIGFSLYYNIDNLAKLIAPNHIQTASICIFICAMSITYININTLQGPARALIGDIVPPKQQVLATTVSSAVQGCASFLANVIGGLQLAKYTNGIFTDEQFMFLIASCFVIIFTTITCLCAREEQFTQDIKKKNPFTQIFNAIKNIPKGILRISIIYFFSWMAYYPFIIETTDFFGQDIYGGKPIKDPEHPELYDKYMEGVSFGMLTVGFSSLLTIFYAFFQPVLIKHVGMKWTYAISQITETCCLLSIFFVFNKWALLCIFLPLGITLSIINSIPFAIVGLNCPQETMGIYMGVLNCFLVVGQQVSNFTLSSGIGTVSTKYFDGKRSPIIGCGAFFSLTAAILCKFIIVPEVKPDTSVVEPLAPYSELQ